MKICHTSLAFPVLTIFVTVCLLPLVHSFKAWDYMVFAQQWSETACIDEDVIKHGEHDCQVPAPVHSWAVHGVWPSKTGSKDKPAFCNKTWEFEESNIKSIEKTMLEFWPNCYRDTSLTSFWAHEWSKHGTCAASNPTMRDQLSYFSTGLKLAQQYNITSWLNAANIRPSNTTEVKLQKIIDVIKQNSGFQPLIECSWSHKSPNQFIGQVFICLDTNFKPRQCPAEMVQKRLNKKQGLNGSSFEPCDGNKTVIYPEIYHIGD